MGVKKIEISATSMPDNFECVALRYVECDTGEWAIKFYLRGKKDRNAKGEYNYGFFNSREEAKQFVRNAIDRK